MATTLPMLPVTEVVTHDSFDELRGICDRMLSHGRLVAISESDYGNGRRCATKFATHVTAHHTADTARWELTTPSGDVERIGFSRGEHATRSDGATRWANTDAHRGVTWVRQVEIDGYGLGENPSRIDSITVRTRTPDNAERVVQLAFVSVKDLADVEGLTLAVAGDAENLRD